MLTLLADLNAPAAVSLAVSCCATAVVPYFLLVGATPADFDPRPVARRALDTGRLDWLLIAVADARYQPRHAAPRRRPLAALLILTIPTGDR